MFASDYAENLRLGLEAFLRGEMLASRDWRRVWVLKINPNIEEHRVRYKVHKIAHFANAIQYA